MRVAGDKEGAQDYDDVIDWVFGADFTTRCGHQQCTGAGHAAGKRILAPHNRAAWTITERMCERLGEPDGESLAINSFRGDSKRFVPPEDLAHIESSGLPPHRLSLRLGEPYMLLRNFRGKHQNGVVYTLRAFDRCSLQLPMEPA